jgi:hypothetical protein
VPQVAGLFGRSSVSLLRGDKDQNLSGLDFLECRSGEHSCSARVEFSPVAKEELRSCQLQMSEGCKR